jgi:hypothetical protein
VGQLLPTLLLTQLATVCCLRVNDFLPTQFLYLITMTIRTVIGLFTDNKLAAEALDALAAAGVHRDALDLLSADDASDAPKLRALSDLVPDPDLSIYLEGVRQGGTLLTAQVPANAEARAAEIIGSKSPVNIREHTVALKARNPELKAEMIDAKHDPNVLEVVEEVVELGKEKVETGRMRIYNVVSESKVSKSIPLVDETVTVQRRTVNRDALEDAFKERVFELSEFDERAIVSKRAQVVEEVNLAKQAETRDKTVTETVRRSDVRAERVDADGKVIESVHSTERN